MVSVMATVVLASTVIGLFSSIFRGLMINCCLVAAVATFPLYFFLRVS